jgi:hypothetical protein
VRASRCCLILAMFAIATTSCGSRAHSSAPGDAGHLVTSARGTPVPNSAAGRRADAPEGRAVTPGPTPSRGERDGQSGRRRPVPPGHVWKALYAANGYVELHSPFAGSEHYETPSQYLSVWSDRRSSVFFSPHADGPVFAIKWYADDYKLTNLTSLAITVPYEGKRASQTYSLPLAHSLPFRSAPIGSVTSSDDALGGYSVSLAHQAFDRYSIEAKHRAGHDGFQGVDDLRLDIVVSQDVLPWESVTFDAAVSGGLGDGSAHLQLTSRQPIE